MRSALHTGVLVVLLLLLTQPGMASDVKSLVKQLASPNYVQQMGAEVELWSYGPESTPIVLQMLKDKDPKIRAAAAQALWHIRDRSALPALYKQALIDLSPEVRAAARDTIEKFTSKPLDLRLTRPRRMSFDEAVWKLEGTDAQQRRKAVSDLRGNQDPRLLELAASLIRDKDREVASGAVEILCGFKDGRADDVILEAWRAGNGYIHSGYLVSYPRSVQLALRMIADSDANRRWEAAYVLCYAEAPEAKEALRTAIRDTSAAVRGMAVEGLGRLGDTGAVPLLVGALGDPDVSVASSSAESLGELKATDAVEPLLALLAKALEAMESSDPAQARRWQSVVPEAEPPVCKVIRALGDIGDPRAVPALTALLKHPENHVMDIAADALGTLHATAAVPDLCGLLADPDNEVRISAADALGSIGDPRAGNSLIAALDHTDPSFVGSCRLALAQLKDPRAFRILLGAVTQPPKRDGSSIMAVGALGELGDKRAFPYILPYLADPDDLYTVPGALAKLGGGQAVKYLMAAIEKQRGSLDPESLSTTVSPDIYECATALMRLDDPAGNAFMAKQVKQGNLNVAYGAWRFVISQGIPESEEVLIKTLGHDDHYLAHDMIKSGNPKLVEAGREYLLENPDIADNVEPNYVSNGPIWGSKVSVGKH